MSAWKTVSHMGQIHGAERSSTPFIVVRVKVQFIRPIMLRALKSSAMVVVPWMVRRPLARSGALARSSGALVVRSGTDPASAADAPGPLHPIAPAPPSARDSVSAALLPDPFPISHLAVDGHPPIKGGPVQGGLAEGAPLWRGDRGLEDRLLLGGVDLEHDGGLLRVALLVDRDGAGDAVEVARARDRVAHLLAVDRRGALDRALEQHHRVVAERGHRVGGLAVARLVAGDEPLHLGARVLGRVVVRVVGAVDRGA